MANNSKLKQGAHKGRRAVRNSGGNAQPPYTTLTASVIALPPGQGPPMSSTQTGGRATTSSVVSSLRGRASRTSSSRAKRKK